MKVVVSSDLCEVNEVCVSLCPEVFRVGEGDRATIRLDPIPQNLRPAVERAVRSNFINAIKYMPVRFGPR